MKQGIHPEYMTATVHCACGNKFETRSTQEDIHLDICSICHPYYTGRQKLIDTAGRVERFRQKWGTQKADAKAGSKKAEAETPKPETQKAEA